MRVYIYGLLDEENNIIYVGKSSRPKSRLYSHRQHYTPHRMKILDSFEDLEFKWIEKLNKVYPLKFNKSTLQETENWEVGEYITVNNTVDKTNIVIKDTVNGIIYNSLKQLSETLKLTAYHTKKVIDNNPDRYIIT
jgi:signal recognition particle subunit SEC65